MSDPHELNAYFDMGYIDRSEGQPRLDSFANDQQRRAYNLGYDSSMAVFAQLGKQQRELGRLLLATPPGRLLLWCAERPYILLALVAVLLAAIVADLVRTWLG